MDARLDRNLRILVDELRPLVVIWLSSLSMGHELFPGTSPLPPGFPFSRSVIHETFRWTSQQRSRAYRVTFEYGGRSPTASIFWSIRSGKWRTTKNLRFAHLPLDTGTVLLGVFEVPPEICDNALRPFLPGRDLVLEAMRKSVETHSAVGLVSEIVEHPVVDGTGFLYYPIEHFDLMGLLDWRLLREDLAARFLEQCVWCSELLPHPGPNLCPTH